MKMNWGMLAIVPILLFNTFSFADEQTCQLPPKETSCPSYPATPPSVCSTEWSGLTPPFDAQHMQSNVRAFERCSEELLNCTKGILGGSGGSLIEDNGKAILRLARDQARYASWIAHYSHTSGSKAEIIKINENPRLARMVTPVVAASSHIGITTGESDIESRYSAADEDTILGRALMSGKLKESELQQMQYYAFLNIWQQLNFQVNNCRQVKTELETFQGRDAAVSSHIQQFIICSLRYRTDHWIFPTLEKWPGCECGGGTGRLLGEGYIPGDAVTNAACVKSLRHPETFDDAIDTRIPGLLREFIASLRRRAAPMVPVDIGIMDCNFQRLETGGNVKKLEHEENPMLTDRHISSHSQGTACDLEYVTFRYEPCGEFTWTMNRRAKKPFFNDLKSYVETNRRTGWKDARREIARRAGGAGEIFRGIEANNRPSDLTTATDSERNLWLGSVVRNALVDVGFTVYDPLTNGVHEDHLHFELPNWLEIYSLNSRSLMTTQQRELVMDPQIKCASGQGPCEGRCETLRRIRNSGVKAWGPRNMVDREVSISNMEQIPTDCRLP